MDTLYCMKEQPVQQREKRFSGLPISEGVALARIQVLKDNYEHTPLCYTISTTDIKHEKARLHEALDQAVKQLERLEQEVARRIGQAQANIFVAQRLMMQDEALVTQMEESIANDRINTEAAVTKSLDAYEALLSEVDDEYMKDRASDIGEIRRRLLDLLRGKPVTPQKIAKVKGYRIIVANELTPSETVALDTAHVAGFITERGGRASHAAILARALGIPAVSGLKGVSRHVKNGDEVLINGATGEVVLHPSQKTLHLYPSAKREALSPIPTVKPVEGIVVMANISLASELDFVNQMQPEGIGLYRTEFEFLVAGRMLNEEEQLERYTRVIKAMDGKPTFVRLLDLGGDKAAAFLRLPNEENPALGYRGSRLLLGHPELFVAQARALARASVHGPISIIYPMIVDSRQFLTLRALFNQHTHDIDTGSIQHGVMLEVPAACMAAHEILQHADFGCIGSNDLIQYLFAVDRNNELVARDYTPDRSVFWDVIRTIVEAANDTDKPLSLCGELGGQPQYLPRLIELGITTISVSPRLIGLARITAQRALRTISNRTSQ